MTIFDLRFRVDAGSVQKATAMRDQVADELAERGVIVVASDMTQSLETFFVMAVVNGEAAQVESEAASGQEAIESVEGPGVVVVGVTQHPITAPIVDALGL